MGKYEVIGEQGQEARVRLFIGEKVLDETFPLPLPPTTDELLQSVVEARLAELETKPIELDALIVEQLAPPPKGGKSV